MSASRFPMAVALAHVALEPGVPPAAVERAARRLGVEPADVRTLAAVERRDREGLRRNGRNPRNGERR